MTDKTLAELTEVPSVEESDFFYLFRPSLVGDARDTKGTVKSFVPVYVDLGDVQGAVVLDMENCRDRVFSFRPIGEVTLSITNQRSDGWYIVLDVTDGGTHVINWPAGIDFVGDVVPDLAVAGRNLVGLSRIGNKNIIGTNGGPPSVQTDSFNKSVLFDDSGTIKGIETFTFDPISLEFNVPGPITSEGEMIFSSATNLTSVVNGTTAQVLRVYKTFTDASNWSRLEIDATPSGYFVIRANRLGSGAENAGIALLPNGTGALTISVPDNAIAGGNARGSGSIDFQSKRYYPTQVANGLNSAISGGRENTANGNYSWIPGGSAASTHGIEGGWGWGSGSISGNIFSQTPGFEGIADSQVIGFTVFGNSGGTGVGVGSPEPLDGLYLLGGSLLGRATLLSAASFPQHGFLMPFNSIFHGHFLGTGYTKDGLFMSVSSFIVVTKGATHESITIKHTTRLGSSKDIALGAAEIAPIALATDPWIDGLPCGRLSATLQGIAGKVIFATASFHGTLTLIPDSVHALIDTAEA